MVILFTTIIHCSSLDLRFLLGREPTMGQMWFPTRPPSRVQWLHWQIKRGISSVPKRSRAVSSEGGISKTTPTAEVKISVIVNKIDGNLRKDHIVQKTSSKSWTICRVPDNLRRVHKHGFDPYLVSIGPFHRYKEHLKPMEEHKLRYLVHLLESMPLPNASATSTHSTTHEYQLSKLVVAMTELEADARACYSETFDAFGSDKFVMMMILDGCFVVQLLRFYAKWGELLKAEELDDPIFTTRWMLSSLKHDLLMLENQLPFVVLKKIFDMSSSELIEPMSTDKNKKKELEPISLIDLTMSFFVSLLPAKHISGLERNDDDNDPAHFLDLLRSKFALQQADDHNGQACWSVVDIPDGVPRIFYQEREILIHCVMELKRAGIEFKKRDDHDLLDIEFKKGKLYIPPLFIDEHTGPVFLNFVAYEQCSLYTEPYFTNYLLFLNSLVNSSKDVEHLHYKGIINHLLGSDEDVADLFNNLCKEVVFELGHHHLSKLLQDVNQYFRLRRHRWSAKWRHDYFSNPWTFSSFLAAIFLLLLTTIQAFFSMFAYFHPPKSQS